MFDKLRAYSHALELRMNDDVDEVGVIKSVANSPSEADELRIVKSKRLSNASGERELDFSCTARLPPN